MQQLRGHIGHDIIHKIKIRNPPIPKSTPKLEIIKPEPSCKYGICKHKNLCRDVIGLCFGNWEPDPPPPPPSQLRI
jgi:hypothetical protein